MLFISVLYHQNYVCAKLILMRYSFFQIPNFYSDGNYTLSVFWMTTLDQICKQIVNIKKIPYLNYYKICIIYQRILYNTN